MPRQVEKTDRIAELIRRATQDPEFNVDSVAIFEARAFNTRPVSKKGTIWEGAVHSVDMLREMSDLFAKGETVPLLAQHRSGLPLGQVFYSEPVRAPDGEFDLHTLFYLPKSEDALIKRLDANVVKETSVGVRPKALLCNKCGFDFMAEDTTWEHLYERTCENGHTIAKDGTRLLGKGLDRWFELSLVDRGAASDTAVLSPSQQVLGKKIVGLAARDAGDRRPYLIASFSAQEPTDPPKHGAKKNVDEIVELKADLTVANRDLKAAQESVTALTAERDALKKTVGELQTTDAAKLKPSLDAAMTFLKEQATASLAALGRPVENLADTAEGLIETIKKNRELLAAVIPAGGVSGPSVDDANKPITRNYGAFKAR